jgi:hypothetical protein
MNKKSTAVRWAGLILQWEESGSTQRAFCQKRGISFWAFRSWRTKIRAQGRKASTADFVELTAALRRPSYPDAATIRISCPGGVVIETQAKIEVDLLVAIITAGRLS